MCGIAGFFDIESRVMRPDGEDILLSQIRTCQYRGPDATAVWQGPGVGLAHARLAIIEPSDADRGADPALPRVCGALPDRGDARRPARRHAYAGRGPGRFHRRPLPRGAGRALVPPRQGAHRRDGGGERGRARRGRALARQGKARHRQATHRVAFPKALANVVCGKRSRPPVEVVDRRARRLPET